MSNWRIWAVLVFFVLATIICAGSAFILRGDLGFEYGIIFPLILFIFIVFYVVFAFFINPLTIANKVGKDERLSSPIQYEVSDEQIMFRNQFAETKLDWGSFQKVIESEEMFLLVYTLNKNMFQIIPKRAFSATVDEQVFRDLLKTKIPKTHKNKFDIKNPAILVPILLAVGFCLFLCAISVFSFFYAAYLDNYGA
ncbi:MAG: YcxB family protein [Chloroflexi bacterium]|nr:YcxB family protein [Chloroflexota bacterium]